MKRPLPQAGPPHSSGSVALCQLALALGMYIPHATAKRLGCPDLDLSAATVPLPLKPLVLGDNFDVALKRLGIETKTWHPPTEKNHRDQLAAAFSFAHTHLTQSHPVLMLMQGETKGQPATVQPLCWLMVDSVLEKRDGTFVISLHNGLDSDVHQRSSTSMRWPSLHKYHHHHQHQHQQQRVIEITVPRSVPITLRAVVGYISPFVGDTNENPLQNVHCCLVPATDLDKDSVASKNSPQQELQQHIQATVTLPNQQLNKSHTLFLFDDPKFVPNCVEDYYGCNCVAQWEFTLIFENTWSTIAAVPLSTGAAIFKCVETRMDPNLMKREQCKTRRKKAKQYLVGETGSGIATLSSKKKNPKELKELKTIRRPIDSRGSGSRSKPTPQILSRLKEVDTLPDFMKPTGMAKNALFIQERHHHLKQQRPTIRVFVHIGGEEFSIECGLGNQNIKWLAIAAAQRYQAAKKGRGCQLTGQIIGTEVHSTKVVVGTKVSSSSSNLTTSFADIKVEQWETNLASAPLQRVSPTHQRNAAKNKRLQRLHKKPLPVAATDTATVTTAPTPVFETPTKFRAGFKPDETPEQRAKANQQLEKKAIGAAEAKFKTLKLLSNTGKKTKTRAAKRKFLSKLPRTGSSSTAGSIQIKTDTQAASKIQAIQRGRLHRRKLKNMNNAAGALQAAFRGKQTRQKLVEQGGAGEHLFAAISERRKNKRKKAVIDSVMGQTKTTTNKDGTDFLKRSGVSKGLGSAPDPFVKIHELLSDEAHCWIDLQTTITNDSMDPLVTMFMDKAYYQSKNKERGARLQQGDKSMAGKQASYWASIMAQEKIKDAQQYLNQMDDLNTKLAPQLLFGVAQLVRGWCPRLIHFFGNYLELLNISENDRILAKNAVRDLKLALSLVGPNSSDSVTTQKKTQEAFVLVMEAMKVASTLVPEAAAGMPALDMVGQPDFNVMDLLKDSRKLHDMMHQICTCEWSAMDEGTAFGIATQVEELKEQAIDALANGKRQIKKASSWAAAAGKVLGKRFSVLSNFVNAKLQEEEEERASMSEFEKLWEASGIEEMVPDRESYLALTHSARVNFLPSKNVFSYFAVIGGGIFDISFSELMLFLKQSGAYEKQKDLQITEVSSAFKKTLKALESSSHASTSTDGSDLDLLGWLVVIVRLAVIRYGDLFHERWDRAYQHFMDMHMLPMGLHVTGDEATMKVALLSPEVAAVSRKYDSILVDIFEQYCDDDGELEMEAYVKLVSDAGLIDADLTRLECRRSFVRCQIASSNEDEITEDNGHDHSMDVHEFVVSLPRLGCDKWDEGGDGALPVYIKQERICKALVVLDPLTVQERTKKERRRRQREM